MPSRAQLAFSNASELSLTDLAALFTACYEGYPYPASTSPSQLARRLREESIDLDASFVLHASGEPVGLGLLALRCHEAWCGGFGLTLGIRGQGLGGVLAAELVRRARTAGAHCLRLEVLAGNTPARLVYEKAGLTIVRTVLVFAWRRVPEADPVAHPPALRSVPVEALLQTAPDRFLATACWQRTRASLLARTGLEALEQTTADGGRAWAVCALIPPQAARLLALSGGNEYARMTLIAALKERFLGIGVVNEPEDSPFVAALTAAGFTESDRQFEMAIDLTETSDAPRPGTGPAGSPPSVR